MHSTSFVLGKGVGCLRSDFCVLVSNIDRLLARGWCLLSAAFAVNSRHRTAAFTAIHWYASSIVATRPLKLQVRSRRALWRFHRRSKNKKEKNYFHEWHNGGGVRANLKTTIEVTNPVVWVDLHAGDAGWRVLQDRSGCMHVRRPRFATRRGHFWLASDWYKQVKQVARSPWQL